MSLINFQKNKKYFMGALGALLLLVLVAVSFVMSNKRTDMEVKFDEKGEILPPPRHWYENDKTQAFKILDYYAELEKLVKKDDVGGATPQETLDLFVEALRAGDTELASKYFMIGKQEQMAKELATGLERGHIDGLIETLEKEKFGKEMLENTYRFRTYDENNVAEFSFDLMKNPDTNVWKIESL